LRRGDGVESLAQQGDPPLDDHGAAQEEVVDPPTGGDRGRVRVCQLNG
jgi:hypothetical protein